MFCPRCGRESSETQRFCKSCGTNLHTVSQAMSGSPVPAAQAAGVQERLRDLNKGIKTIFTGIGLAVFFAFVTHSWAPVGIGLMIFCFGLGQVAKAMLSAHPRLDIEVQMPGREPVHDHAQKIPAPEPRSVAPLASAATPGSVTEDATMRLGTAEPYGRPERK